MKNEIIYSLQSPYRNEFRIHGYRFGSGDKTACIVGAIRGNEIQQLYICSQLVGTLKRLEEKGAIASGREILVIPTVNNFSMNIGKRFWTVDNTDINRMFPGSAQGEVTQRIAAGVFAEAQQYQYGIQFASFYMPGDFIPHVRMMETGFQTSSLASLFGLQYVVVRKPRPVDTSTLNYNLQKWKINAFSVYTNQTEAIDEKSAALGVGAVLRFLMRMGIIKYTSHGGYISSVVQEENLVSVKTTAAGIFRRLKNPSDEVNFGEVIAEILHPYEGTVLARILSPTDGIVFFTNNHPLVIENTVVCKIIRRLHV
ncbi:MAG: M14 family metallopeptidase [Acetanaerobacterium sp.]